MIKRVTPTNQVTVNNFIAEMGFPLLLTAEYMYTASVHMKA